MQIKKKICTRNRTHKYRELYCYIAVLRNLFNIQQHQNVLRNLFNLQQHQNVLRKCSSTPTRIQQHFNNIKRYSTSLTFGVAKERAPFRAPFSGDETSPSVELSA